MEKLTINYFGDFCPIGKFEKKDIVGDSIWLGKLQDSLDEADINILNLECPLTTEKKPISKSGPNLKANPDTIQILKDIKIDVVCLANNHIMDFGDKGLRDTLVALEEAGIKYVGAGLDIHEAKRPLIIKKKGISFAFINVCETEFSIADQGEAGAAPLDLIENYYTILDAKKSVDHVIMIIHGGIEHYPHPTPRQLKQYRFFASLGVSAIIGHHSHHVQDWEVYKGVPIFYSLGNFVFDEAGNPPGWEKGLLVSHIFDKHNLRETQYSTFEMDYDSTPIVKDVNTNILIETHRIDERKVLESWSRYVDDPKRIRNRVNSIQKNAFLVRALNKLKPSLLKKRVDLATLNVIRNESHYEYLVSAIEDILKEEK